MAGFQPMRTYGDRLSDGKLQTHAHWLQKSHGEALDRPIWRGYETRPSAISCFCHARLVAHEPRSHLVCFPRTPDGGYRGKASVSRGRQMRRSRQVHVGVWDLVRVSQPCVSSCGPGGVTKAAAHIKRYHSITRFKGLDLARGLQSLAEVCCRPHRAVWRARSR